MGDRRFSKKEALGFGWQLMKKNLGFFIGILLFMGFVNFAPDIINKFIPKEFILFSLVITFVFWVLQTIIGLGFLKITLKLCDSKEVRFSDLFSCLSVFFKYLGSLVIFLLIMLGGFILLIIPGIIWSIKFGFFDLLIIDQGLSPIEALKRSAQMTKGVKWDLFIFSIVVALVMVAGALCLLIGLFATIPTIYIARAFVYRKLLSQIETSKLV